MVTNFNYLSEELRNELSRIANALTVQGKGILAADESDSTIGKHFDEIEHSNNEETRRQYRQILFKSDLNQYISGVIMSHETVYQETDEGITFIQLLRNNNIISGIKLDTGVTVMFGTENEFTTQGFQDLQVRCALYKEDGCDFARWRCVLSIGEDIPTCQAITENANNLALFAAICQSQGIVPIIEADILTNGAHDIKRCRKVTEVVLAALFKALNDNHVYLEGTILKPSMVTAGIDAITPSLPREIAFHTVTALRRTVPVAVPGIVFFCTNQSKENASCHLNAINQVPFARPWTLTFSYCLQTSVLCAWNGKSQNITKAQEELVQHVKVF